MELFVSIVYHVFYILLVQGLLYIFYASHVEKELVNKFIALQIAKKLNQDPSVRDLARVVLPLLRFPQTCVHYENKHWRESLWMFLVLAFLVVVVVSLGVNMVAPEVPVIGLAVWNLAIFVIIGVFEFFFFKQVVLKYSEVSLKDMLETIRLALQTDPQKNDK